MSNFEETVESLIGESFDDDEVPDSPGRIYWRDGSLFTGFPHAPVRVVQVRFRKACATEDGDWTVIEARRVDTSKPDDLYGKWKRYRAIDSGSGLKVGDKLSHVEANEDFEIHDWGEIIDDRYTYAIIDEENQMEYHAAVSEYEVLDTIEFDKGLVDD